MIRLRVLGRCSLEREDGTSIQAVLAQPKRFALLTYLAAVHPPVQRSRDTLTALLWPDSDEGHARGRLRQALHGLRRALGPGVITGTGTQRVGVDVRQLWCDAAAVQAAVESGEWEEALAFFGGDFLDGFHVAGALKLEHWIEAERTRLGREVVGAAWRLVAAAERAGDHADARHWAERSLQLAPYEEDRFRQYLGLLDRQADRASAVRAFDVFARRLMEDLGLEPSGETVALIERMRSATPAVVRSLPQPEPAGTSGLQPDAPDAGDLNPDVGDEGAGRRSWRGVWAVAGPLRLAGLVALVAAAGGLIWVTGWPGSGVRRTVDDRPASRVPGLGSAPATAGGPISARSVAVLPFENLSSSPENAYFTAGVQEQILTDLARIPDLKVISRESVMAYRGHPAEVRKIGRELGVAHLLEGAVQREGRRVRISVQLIDATRDAHLWAATYDRDVTDVFPVESEVAAKVAGALRARLDSAQRRQFAVVPTPDTAAYEAYLQGRAYEIGGLTDRLSLPRAVQGFTRAVTLDPTFALAWARLAITQSFAYYSWDHSRDRAEAARRAVERAVALAPESGETQLALGNYEYLCQEDYARARAAYQRALVRLPNNARVQWALGNIDRVYGQWTSALEHENRSMALDPKDPFVITETAWTYVTLRRFDAALALVDRVLAITPANPGALALRASILQAEGDLAAAQETLAAVTPTPTEPAIFATILDQDLYTRDYGAADGLLRTALARADSLPAQVAGGYHERLGYAERLAGHQDSAQAEYTRARRLLRAVTKADPENPSAFAALGLAEAGLGHEQAALAAGRRAVALGKSNGDVWTGPALEETLARIEAVIGRSDQAVAALHHLLATPYVMGPAAPVTPALLRLDPSWDPLRRDPRFQALMTHDVPPSLLPVTSPQPTDSRRLILP